MGGVRPSVPAAGDAEFAPIGKVALPKGSYLLVARATLMRNGPAQRASCSLKLAQWGLELAYSRSDVWVDTVGVNVPLSTMVTLPEASTVEFVCWRPFESESGTFADWPSLSAVQVATLNRT